MFAVLDDHLLRDHLAGPDAALVEAIGVDDVATTNLWYARLCKSAAAHRQIGALARWSEHERDVLIGALMALPDVITVAPLRALAWRMGVLIDDHGRLSTLGAEAVAAAEVLAGRLLVSSRDDGAGIRACAEAIGVGYQTVAR